MKTKYNNSIGIRFSIRVFFISIVIAIFAIAIELYIRFQENKGLARTSIQQVSESHIPALISSLWLTHSKLLQEQVDAITRFKYIAGVEVTDIDNNQFSAGEISNQDHSLITRDLLYEFRERKTLIGKLKLYIDDSQIMRDTFSREIPTFFLFFLQSLIVAIVIGLLFRGMVGQHLETFSQFLVKSRNDPNIERFNFNRKRTYHDELESLLQSFNISEAARIAAEEKIKENLKEKETLLQKIHQSEKKYREILEGLNDAAYRMSLPDGKYEYMSQSAKNIFGYSSNEFLNNPLLVQKIIHPDFVQYFEERWADLNQGIIPKTYEYKIIAPEGNEKWIFQSNTLIHDDQNRTIGIEGLCRDITEQKKLDEQIKANLQEKETLLQEIHHRVKNNMTVISSLLALQMNSTDNKIAKEALQDSQNRVQSMSMIHETLYRSDNLADIDLATYLSDLGEVVLQNYAISKTVHFKVKAESVMIDSKLATTVGLIVNELIANCLKYAFTDDREGEILLELKSDKENGVELTVSDNGIGIPEGFDLKTADSLGLKLVKMLVENQLDGSVDMENGNGTKFTIKFNIET